jgi:hypothetical protein
VGGRARAGASPCLVLLAVAVRWRRVHSRTATAIAMPPCCGARRDEAEAARTGSTREGRQSIASRRGHGWNGG